MRSQARVHYEDGRVPKVTLTDIVLVPRKIVNVTVSPALWVNNMLWSEWS